MDYSLQQLYRAYLREGSFPAYMAYYLGAERAGAIPVCWSGAGECPHCVLGQIDRLYAGLPEREIIHHQLLQMFLYYELTPNGTYLLRQASLQVERSAPYLPALYYALIPRREPSTTTALEQQETQVRYIPRVPRLREIRGHGELCWGGDPFTPNSDYYFTEWPQPEDARSEEDFHPNLDRWIEDIQSIEANCGAVYADIEAKPVGPEFIHPELGPINMHGDKWSMCRITFLDEAGYQPTQHETLFIGQCLDNVEGCYGHDEIA